MAQEYEISIIVPVYKVEKYVRQCIESILSQTFSEFELLLIDDGSPDSCGEICDEYADCDNRIRVIHKKNGGLMSAWITGAMAAQAPYIGFVDSDDWIEPDMYETLYGYITGNKADMAACCMYINYHDREIKVGKKETEIFEGSRIGEKLIPQLLTNWSTENPRIQNGRCDKLFRRELIINNIRLCNTAISTGEDLNIVFAALLDSQKVVCIGSRFLYHYRIRTESITNSYSSKLLENNIKLVNALKRIANEKHFNSKELTIHAAYTYYQVLCDECLSGNPMREKIMRVKSVIKSMPSNINFSDLRKQLLNSGQCSNNRKISLYLLTYKLWWLWVIGNHLVSKNIQGRLQLKT